LTDVQLVLILKIRRRQCVYTFLANGDGKCKNLQQMLDLLCLWRISPQQTVCMITVIDIGLENCLSYIVENCEALGLEYV